MGFQEEAKTASGDRKAIDPEASQVHHPAMALIPHWDGSCRDQYHGGSIPWPEHLQGKPGDAVVPVGSLLPEALVALPVAPWRPFSPGRDLQFEGEGKEGCEGAGVRVLLPEREEALPGNQRGDLRGEGTIQPLTQAQQRDPGLGPIRALPDPSQFLGQSVLAQEIEP